MPSSSQTTRLHRDGSPASPMRLRLTSSHVSLWTACNAPSWVKDAVGASWRLTRGELVEACVCANAEVRVTRGELAAHNLMSLLRRARLEGPSALSARLLELAHHPGTVVDPKRRSGFALKWYKRLSSNTCHGASVVTRERELIGSPI